MLQAIQGAELLLGTLLFLALETRLWIALGVPILREVGAVPTHSCT